MRKFAVCLVLAGAAALSTGCGMQFGGQSNASSHGGIAVVDLDRVSAATGKSLEMKETFSKQENALTQVLVNAQNSVNSQLEAKAKEMGFDADAADETKLEFNRIRSNAAGQLAQVQKAAGAKLSQLRQEQIAQYRTELKPILRDVAAKRGLSTVIPKNDGLLLCVDAGVDITDDVIAEYAKRPAAPAAPAAPAVAAKPAASATK